MILEIVSLSQFISTPRTVILIFCNTLIIFTHTFYIGVAGTIFPTEKHFNNFSAIDIQQLFINIELVSKCKLGKTFRPAENLFSN